MQIGTVVFLPFHIKFLLSLSLIALAWTSSLLWNRSHERRHPCLILDLMGKALSLSILNMMIAVGFLKTSFVRLRNFPPFSGLLRVLSWSCWILSNDFYTIWLMRSCSFSFSVCLYVGLRRYLSVDLAFIPGISLSVVMPCSFYTLVSVILAS